MQMVLKTAAVLVKLVLAVLFTCLMVTVIPFIQQALLGLQFTKSDAPEERRVLAEIIRPPKKDPPKPQAQRMQKVDAHISNAGPAASGMHFNFSPDLGVEGGGAEVEASSKGSFTAVVFNEGETDEDVVPLTNPSPPYPAAASERGIQGDVELIFVVNTDGKVESLEIVKMPHPSFAAEIRKTVQMWRFKPGKNQGVPVKVRCKKVIQYKLDENNQTEETNE